jgi:hypothetical protein
MGWSPWITGSRTISDPGTILQFLDAQDGYTPDFVYDAPLAWTNALSNHSFTSWPVSGAINFHDEYILQGHAGLSSAAHLDQGAIQVTAPSGYETNRYYFPPALWDLTEGVDFSLIPGTSDYVEYQAGGVSVLSGWAMPPILFTFPIVHTVDGDLVPGLAEFFLQTGSVTQPFPVDTPFASYEPSDSVLSVYPPDPGPVDQFWLTARLTERDSIPPFEYTGGATLGQIYASWSAPDIYIILPPYRYWILGTPPLRQIQRDDGLGRSVMRARSTHSVQKSIRQRGYR